MKLRLSKVIRKEQTNEIKKMKIRMKQRLGAYFLIFVNK